jgi:hypothetical protein
MIRHLSALSVVALFAGCGGVIAEPTDRVATLELEIDQAGALRATACLALYGESGCSPYPNPMECDSLIVSVQRDGRTCGVCVAGGKKLREFCGGMAEGIPLACRASNDLGCQQCVDLYGNALVDSCNRGTQLFRGLQSGGLSQLPPGVSGWLDEPTGTAPERPGQEPSSGNPDNPLPAGDGSCNPEEARLLFAKELNRIFASEGLNMTYSQQGSQNAPGLSGLGSNQDQCKQWINYNSLLTQCWSSGGGSCFCKNQVFGRACKCSRMTIAALRTACKQVPPGCEGSWSGVLVAEYGAASAWLNSSSFPSTFFGDMPFLNQGFSGSQKSDLFCSGSPLVLDLADDGVQPTSPEGGVSFDLLGQGAVRTAWVGGDDALLALDRDGNGRIDDGTELFGDATRTHEGGLADDGFAALAALDRTSLGGNGNGLVDGEDLMFDALRLWTDGNRNGRSEPGELRTLYAAGVAAIEVAGREEAQVNDLHGNDLSLRSAFVRADGSRGLVVDVVFRLGR